ncbi:Putative hybrid sensor histidine kinase [Vibrio harveyi]|uniref:response regulator n=1 Tax=Vibrio harveyi TaxID=669 RepID=UPI002AD5F884|nr:response regulator [Vibrio harveyi]CAK6711721.1 Putative hybrid sensor histidine kinase [Vibrio harveyi]
MEKLPLSKPVKMHLLLALLAGVFLLIDLNIPLGVAAGVPYVTVILVSLASNKQSTTFIWAVICTLLTLVGFYMSPVGGELWKVTSNRGLAIYAIWSVAIVSIILFERTKQMMALESDLKMSEFRSTLGQVAEYASDAIVITDAKGYVTWVNKGFTDISGFELDEVKGKKPGDVLQGKGTELNDIKRLSEAIKAGEKIDLEILNYHKDGSPYWIDLSINPVYENNKLIKFVAVERDITSRKQLEEALAERALSATKETDLKSRFVTLMIEQLQPPLTKVLHSTEQINSEVESGPLKECALQLQGASSVIQAVIKNVDTLSNLNIDKLEMNNELIDMQSLIKKIQEVARELASRHQTAFTFQCEYPDDCTLNSDSKLITHVLYFFLLNTLTRSSTQTASLRIKPSSAKGAESMLLEVEYNDDGSSLSSMKPSSLSTKDKLEAMEGASVAYNIVFAAVNKVGGLVTQERPSKNRTRISILLPAAIHIEAKDQELPQVSKRVLIAEDNRVNAMVLTKLMQSIGYDEFDVAKNGQEAVEYAKQHQYFVILMDNHMPVMSGIEATQVIKNSIMPKANIIACTADTGVEAKQDFLKAGASQIIYKPINKQKLIDTLGVNEHSEKLTSDSTNNAVNQ